MIIIGADYHPSFQQIAWLDTSSGESGEQRLQHNEEAEKFYRDLKERGVKVRIGMEAGGHARWLERLLAERLGPRALLGALFTALSRTQIGLFQNGNVKVGVFP